ncbi:hypothetical protein BGX29_004767 [Mortierella sp. GBA35]|nr:hypothetical protein BGX29_004767 [Mortierella sp. GBA35]
MSDSPAFQSFLRTVAPSKFSAKANEDVNDWLTKVNRYFEMLKLSSADRVLAATMLLDGLPAKWAVHVPAAPKNHDPWQHFGHLLCQRFQSRNSKFFARQKLHNLKQRGSVTKYNLQFETIRSVLDDFGEAEAMHCYFMGLKPKIREHFAGNPNLRTDLSTMMNIAECLDNEQFHNATEFQPSTVKSHFHSESFPQPMDLDAMTGSNDHEKAKQKQLDLKNRTCFKCHAPGHQSRNCPKNPHSGKTESH